jgi:hypothetical protein
LDYWRLGGARLKAPVLTTSASAPSRIDHDMTDLSFTVIGAMVQLFVQNNVGTRSIINHVFRLGAD